mmetsp:Transcript_2307/g.4426  ORF Transcript_2307/g.4426 Transcript_2307/m.4426 type:complete len:207 (+) Transcript_2307:338-958(+)
MRHEKSTLTFSRCALNSSYGWRGSPACGPMNSRCHLSPVNSPSCCQNRCGSVDSALAPSTATLTGLLTPASVSSPRPCELHASVHGNVISLLSRLVRVSRSSSPPWLSHDAAPSWLAMSSQPRTRPRPPQCDNAAELTHCERSTPSKLLTALTNAAREDIQPHSLLLPDTSLSPSLSPSSSLFFSCAKVRKKGRKKERRNWGLGKA